MLNASVAACIIGKGTPIVTNCNLTGTVTEYLDCVDSFRKMMNVHFKVGLDFDALKVPCMVRQP
jgi:hypothetical protein